MKFETSRCFFSLLAGTDVADDGDDTDDVVLLVQERRITTLENSRLSVRVSLQNYFLSREGCGKAIPTVPITQKRKHIDDTLAQHFSATEAGDALHRPVPGNEPAVAIEREHAIDAGVDHSLEKLCGVVFQVLGATDWCESVIYVPNVSNIKLVAARTSMFVPSITGLAKVDACATSS